MALRTKFFSCFSIKNSKGSKLDECKTVQRCIPSFYVIADLHLIDWSSNNHMVVALAGCVYVWNAGDGNIHSLVDVEPPEYICSLKWVKEGQHTDLVMLYFCFARKNILGVAGKNSYRI